MSEAEEAFWSAAKEFEKFESTKSFSAKVNVKAKDSTAATSTKITRLKQAKTA